MLPLPRRALSLLSLLLAMGAPAWALKVGGSTLVGLVATDAAKILHDEKGMKVIVAAGGGSAEGMAGVATGALDVGMSSWPLTEEERRRHPGVNLYGVPVGFDAVVLAVSRELAEIEGLTKEQLKGLYEGRTRSWKELGGPDLPVVFVDGPEGGTRELFATWLYGSPKGAPPPPQGRAAATVREEAVATLARTKGSIAPLPAGWTASDDRVALLAVEGAPGALVRPDPAEIVAQRYPMARPLLFLTNGPPTGDAETFIELVLTPRGQELVKKHGYLTLSEGMPKAAAPPK